MVNPKIIQMRVKPEQKEVIAQAAEKLGVNFTSYCRMTLLKEARALDKEKNGVKNGEGRSE